MPDTGWSSASGSTSSSMAWFVPFSKKGRIVLVELGVVKQRYQAVLVVLGGASVTGVARGFRIRF
jgi:hypothetical protein